MNEESITLEELHEIKNQDFVTINDYIIGKSDKKKQLIMEIFNSELSIKLLQGVLAEKCNQNIL